MFINGVEPCKRRYINAEGLVLRRRSTIVDQRLFVRSKMFPIKNLQSIYKFPNIDDTFSEGYIIEGAVTFTLSKQVKVKCVLVKLKGDAIVSWEEGTGDNKRSYSDQRRYFNIKKYLVEQNNGRPKKWMDTCYFSSSLHLDRIMGI